MHLQSEKTTDRYGLLANGSSRVWDVSIDESLDRSNEWTLEIDGPSVYLVIQLRVRFAAEFSFGQMRTQHQQ